MKQKFFMLAALLCLASCTAPFYPEDTDDKNAVRNFDQIWNDFDAYYGLFEAKHLDWDSLYAVYRPQVQEGTDEEGLYQVVTQMLGHLNDHHITLFPAGTDLPRWSNDLTNGVFIFDEFDLDVVKTYVSGWHEAGDFLQWGTLADNIGYMHISSFPDKIKPVETALEQALNGLNSTRAIMLDIRDCPGGFDPAAQYIAGRFATTRSLYMTVRKRNGPKKTDFGPAVEWYVEPTGSSQFTKPVILLTSRATGSAGETFTWAMNRIETVQQLGDTTSGAFSDNIMRETWNGWMYTISVGDYRAADGKSYEGIGVAPKVFCRNEKAEVLAGKDRVLEMAVTLVP
jgi:hypothetical protein